MDFGLSEEQELIRDSFQGSLSRLAELDTVRRTAEAGAALDEDIWAELCGLGMAGLLIGEDYGGAGLGLLEAAVVAEELGRRVVPVPFVASAVMAPLAIRLGGDEDQCRAWLPAMADGSLRVGVAVSESAAGAREDAGVTAENGVLSGRALFVLDGVGAEGFVVADNAGGLHLVRADAAGLDRVGLKTIDRTRAVSELRFENTPADPLRQGEGVLRSVIDAGRVILAADSLGAGEEMLRQAVDYAGERKQFGRAIGSFQAVKHMCAEMASELQPCRALVWYGAYAMEHEPAQFSLAAAFAKSHVDEVGRFVARTATEVHGGMGFTDLMGLHYWFKRLGVNRAYLGSPERVRDEAARLQGFAA
ncbi:MAG: acyl-CoA dehydrogenase family protein [Alphaproteobacteria bacterium]|jgi:alkylation response protein AidB-like acyl-CoA dehydrogenase|nr:acyl-CoA dehydrogenase family protein [Alphaproteobacteria bacterium]MDP6815348.1 acyl-CoA dehydrogenase family protein [Alphaproteobacteria bacterium]